MVALICSLPGVMVKGTCSNQAVTEQCVAQGLVLLQLQQGQKPPYWTRPLLTAEI